MIPEKDMHDLKSLSRAARGGTLDPERLAIKAYAMGSEACHRVTVPIESLNLAELEKQAVIRAIGAAGNVIDAAKLLGIGKTTAYRKLREYGLSRTPVCPNCGERIQYAEA
jgi:transcriptional regulator of acetoin/glycerol metabolism